MRGVTRSLITNKVGSRSIITNNTNLARTVINPIETVFLIEIKDQISEFAALFWMEHAKNP